MTRKEFISSDKDHFECPKNDKELETRSHIQGGRLI
jgi:hypothetical protein